MRAGILFISEGRLRLRVAHRFLEGGKLETILRAGYKRIFERFQIRFTIGNSKGKF